MMTKKFVDRLETWVQSMSTGRISAVKPTLGAGVSVTPMEKLRHGPPKGVPDFEYLKMRGDWTPAVGHRVCVHSVSYEEDAWFGRVIEIAWLGPHDPEFCVLDETSTAKVPRKRWCTLAELERPLGELFASRLR